VDADRDAWGRHLPPQVPGDALPPLPEGLTEASLLAAEPLRSPGPADLPEVQALMAGGWEPLEGAPLFSNLPAVWPAEHRCWVPDRLPRLVRLWDGARWRARPWDGDLFARDAAERAASARACGLEPPPDGRLWLLRSPWPTIGVDVVLHLIARRADELGLDLTTEGFTAAAPELLARSEDEIWEWWAPQQDHPARQWRAQGRVGRDAAPVVLAGLSPADLSRLLAPLPDGAGLSEPQALSWCSAVGETGHEAVRRIRAWRSVGLPVDPPDGCLVLTEEPAAFDAWFAAGFELTVIEFLARFGLPAALQWRSAGYEAAAARALLLADPTLTPGEARAFTTAGVPDADRELWVESGFSAAEAVAWSQAGVLPNEARVWRSCGLSPADAATRPRSGDDHGPVLPPGVNLGWAGFGPGRAGREYGVTDPPGTRGRLATGFTV